MRALWCAIWMLGALLVIAAVDNMPDPPAAGPAPAQFLVAAPHDTASPAIQFCHSLGAFFRSTVRFDAVEALTPPPLTSRMVFTEQAADPSPPTESVFRA
jgi:hypothetical protein